MRVASIRRSGGFTILVVMGVCAGVLSWVRGADAVQARSGRRDE